MTKRDNLPPPDDKTGQLSNPRHYGIDLLRMLSMYMVCMHHVLLHGGILSGTATEPIKHNIALFFNMSAYCAVNCFALIFGYVGVKSAHQHILGVRVVSLGIKSNLPQWNRIAILKRDLLR